MKPEIPSDRLELFFRRGKRLFFCGICAYALLLGMLIWLVQHLWPHPWSGISLFLKDHPLLNIATLILAFASRMTHVGAIILKEVKSDFFKRSSIQAAAASLANVTKEGVRQPRFLALILAEDLTTFEKRILEAYRDLRKIALKRNHLRKAAEVAETSAQRSDDLDQKFAQAVLAMGNQREIDRQERRYAAAPSFETKRAIIAKLESIGKRHNDAARRQTEKKQRFSAILGELAADGLCKEALTLLGESQKNPYANIQMDCLKKAITAQKEYLRKRAAEAAAQTATS